MTVRVAVVGGGVAGLATAFHLQRAGADPVVFERAGTHGGVIAPPVEVGGLSLEAGPDSFAARKPWGASLCRDLGLSLVAPGASGALLWTNTGLVPYLAGTAFGIPGDVGDVLRWPGLSSRGRVRALADLAKRKRRDGVEETLGQLLRRRLGNEATDLAISPLLGGLYAGDVDRLSATATFPELVTWERTQGSLVRGAQAAQRSGRHADPGPLFLRPRRGMRELVDALAGSLGDRVRTGAEVKHVAEGDIQLEDGPEPVDAAVLACGAPEASALLGHGAPGGLEAIHSVSTGVVLLVYPLGTADALPDGTGFVVPRGAAPMTAATFVSRKWPDESYADRAVIRCYFGGAGDESVLEARDGDIVGACALHLSAALDLPGPAAG
ncbi:MAG: protoporphyrinogen oxidase, partial [Actinomycetota bacterium]|nr:protoporphyrinogen oxidase [Actinomycetota bacterium]